MFWLVLSSPDSQNPKIEQLSIGGYRWIFCGHFEKGEITSGCPENFVSLKIGESDGFWMDPPGKSSRLGT